MCLVTGVVLHQQVQRLVKLRLYECFLVLHEKFSQVEVLFMDDFNQHVNSMCYYL